MKALSLRPEWAMPVLLGMKTIECRTWKTDHRGDLLICASSRRCPATIAGKALCVVTLDGIEPFRAEHLQAAMLDDDELPESAYAWHLSSLRWLEPFDVKGRLRLFEVPDDFVREIPETISDQDALRRFYEPHIFWGRDEAQARAVWAEATGLPQAVTRA